MNILTVMTLAILQLSPLSGAQMPKYNILGIRLDVLRREAHLVLGRKQSLLEVDAHPVELISPAVETTVTSSPEGTGELWRLKDGHLSGLEVFYKPWTHGGLATPLRWSPSPAWFRAVGAAGTARAGSLSLRNGAESPGLGSSAIVTVPNPSRAR